MKRFWSFFALAAAILFLTQFFLSGCGKEEATSPIVSEQQSAGPQFLTLQFDHSVTFVELADLALAKKLSVEEIRLEFDGFTSGYTVEGRDLRVLEADFYQQHETFLRTMMKPSSAIVETLSTKGFMPFATLLEKSVRHDVPISIVTFRTPVSDQIRSELGAELREDVVVLQNNRPMPNGSQENDDPNIAAPQSMWHERWAPYGGTSEVPRSYTYQSFKFNNMQDFSGGNRTYEHETQIYNRNYANYGGYWATSMPYGYKDTQFGDTMDNFTVGTYRADRLSAYTWYWTYMSLSRQSASSAVCKIRGQIGHRNPSWCYSTWCVWADATTYPGQLASLTLPNYGFCWQY
ncbi:MAG: hypothetical protein V1778_00825 [bacterium]